MENVHIKTLYVAVTRESQHRRLRALQIPSFLRRQCQREDKTSALGQIVIFAMKGIRFCRAVDAQVIRCADRRQGPPLPVS